MKSFIILSLLFIFSSCGYDILDSKFGEPVESISNLDYSISASQVVLTWKLPSSYPNDVIKPASVFIRVTRISKENNSEEYPLYSPNALNAGTFTIPNEPESFIYNEYDSDYRYRFTIKVVCNIEVRSINDSELRYSPGVVIEI